MVYWLVDHRPGSGSWRSASIDIVDELVLHKNGWLRNNNYLHTVLNNVTLSCTKYYQNWLISVEDIASKSSVIFEHDWKDPFFGIRDSQGSAETLVRRGWITNYHLIAYSFSNTSAKKLPKSVDVHWSYSVQRHCNFFETQCRLIGSNSTSFTALHFSNNRLARLWIPEMQHMWNRLSTSWSYNSTDLLIFNYLL